MMGRTETNNQISDHPLKDVFTVVCYIEEVVHIGIPMVDSHPHAHSGDGGL